MGRVVYSLILVSATSILRVISAQGVSVTRTNDGSQTFAPGDLIWEDNFDTLDRNKWHNEININGGYNNEFQIYDDYNENAYTRDGVLYIRPTQSLETVFGGNFEQLYNGYLSLEGCTDFGDTCARQASYPYINQPVVSQRLRTLGSFSFTYGRVEVRARMPSGDWTWPAIWMLPEESKYGGWPASGEIDVVESRGNRKLYDANSGENVGSERVGSTLHFGPNNSYNGFQYATGELNSAIDQGFDRDFHIYETTWTSDMIETKVDGNVVVTVRPPAGGFFELGRFPGNVGNPWANGRNPRMAPFDENFHFILNVAIGGDYFYPSTNPPPPWGGNTNFLDFFNNRDSWQPTWDGEGSAMAVDYIRVYAV